MNKRVSQIMRLALALSMLAFLSACISTQPTPNYARTGDVVNINLGGIKRNAGGDLILPSDIQSVTITDSNSVTRDAQVLGIYRAYPEYMSSYSVTAQSRENPYGGAVHPNDGAVWLEVRLVDSANNPLPLAVGPASIAVASSKLSAAATLFPGGEGNYSDFPLEIIPGVANLDEGTHQFAAYRSDPYLSLKPSGSFSTAVGGLQVELLIDENQAGTEDVERRLVPVHHDPNLNLVQSMTDNGNGTKTLTAVLTNPNGFVDLASWSQGQSTFFDLDLALISYGNGLDGVSTANLGSYVTITANSYYVDLNGDVIPGVAPTLSNEFLP